MTSSKPQIILLAAGIGRRFGRRARKLPKCLIPLGSRNEHLLGRYLKSFAELGLSDILIVVGHQARQIMSECRKKADSSLKIRFIRNKEYRKGSILSLHCALNALKRSAVIMDADVYFPTILLKKFISNKKGSTFLADTRSKSHGEEMMLMAKNGRLWSISKKLNPSLEPVGEATGFFMIEKKHLGLFKSVLRRLVRSGHAAAEYEEVYDALLKKIRIGLVPVGKTFWTEMDFEADRGKILKHFGLRR